jgi:hypothetical protein
MRQTADGASHIHYNGCSVHFKSTTGDAWQTQKKPAPAPQWPAIFLLMLLLLLTPQVQQRQAHQTVPPHNMPQTS